MLLVRDIGRVRDDDLPVGDDDPAVRQAGRFLGPENGWVEGLHVPTPPEHLLDTVAAQVAAGVAWVKIVGDWRYGTEIRQNYDTALMREASALAHAGGARLAVHALAADACRAAVECGADSVEHGCLLDGDLLAAMADRGTAWTPTLTAVTTPRDGASDADRERRGAWLDNMRALLPRAAALGVPVLAGTDTAPHGAIAREVALLVEFGLDPVGALRAATTTARVPRRARAGRGRARRSGDVRRRPARRPRGAGPAGRSRAARPAGALVPDLVDDARRREAEDDGEQRQHDLAQDPRRGVAREQHGTGDEDERHDRRQQRALAFGQAGRHALRP